MPGYTIISLSETVLLVSFGNEISTEVHKKVMSAMHRIEANPFDGFIETIPAYHSLAICYEPLQIEKKEATIAASVIKKVEAILETTHPIPYFETPKPLVQIPVCYDPEFGIDLSELSSILNVSIETIIQLHCSRTYKVYMLGFTPGFPYMGIVDEKLFTKRKKQPRLNVEAGSVAIAGNQTGIYPLATPGGWNIIGKTPFRLFDPTKEHPFLVKAGDEVQFITITKEEYLHWEKK